MEFKDLLTADAARKMSDESEGAYIQIITNVTNNIKFLAKEGKRIAPMPDGLTNKQYQRLKEELVLADFQITRNGGNDWINW